MAKKKDKGFFGRVAGAFVETGDEEELKEGQEKPAEEQAAPVVAKPASVPMVMPVVGGEVDPAMLETLMSAIQTKGPYASFMEMVETLNMIPDEAMRYQAALKTVEKNGLSPERIAKSLADRNTALAGEQEDFERTVTGKQAEISGLQQEAADIGQEIENLKQQIADKEAAKKAKEDEVAREQQSLVQMQSKFATAVAAVQKVLQDAQDKLNRYLNGGK